MVDDDVDADGLSEIPENADEGENTFRLTENPNPTEDQSLHNGATI